MLLVNQTRTGVSLYGNIATRLIFPPRPTSRVPSGTIVTSEPCKFAFSTYIDTGEAYHQRLLARTGGDDLTLPRVVIILEASSRRRNRKRLVRLRDRRHRCAGAPDPRGRPSVGRRYARARVQSKYPVRDARSTQVLPALPMYR